LLLLLLQNRIRKGYDVVIENLYDSIV